MSFGKEPMFPLSGKRNEEQGLEQGDFNPEFGGDVPDATEFDENGVAIGGEIYLNDPDENDADPEHRSRFETVEENPSEESE